MACKACALGGKVASKLNPLSQVIEFNIMYIGEAGAKFNTLRKKRQVSLDWFLLTGLIKT